MPGDARAKQLALPPHQQRELQEFDDLLDDDNYDAEVEGDEWPEVEQSKPKEEPTPMLVLPVTRGRR